MIFSTVWSGDDAFNARVHTIDRRKLPVLGVLRAMLQANDNDVVIINGALGFRELWRDLILACTVRALRHRPGFVVADATWEQRSTRSSSSAPILHRLNGMFSRWLVRRLLDDRTVLCFLSNEEARHFIAQTGCSAVFTPFTTTIPWDELDSLLEARAAPDPYIFSGGNTLRDWDLLCEALGDCGVRVRVATRHVDRVWPSNFDVGPCTSAEFLPLMAGAQICVSTLKSDSVRSAGQQTYLNALRLGCPVVVNDAVGVRDHLADVPGAFITSSASAMRAIVAWLLDPANAAEVDDLSLSGATFVAKSLSESNYLERLADIAEALDVRLSL